MNDDNISILIRFLSIIFLAYGSIKLIFGMKHLWLSLQFIFYPSNNTLRESIYYFAMSFFFNTLIPTFALISGIGLLKQRKWGWYFAVTTTFIVFVLSLTGTINFIVASYHYRNIPMPPIPEGAVVHRISMIPTYISAAGSLLLLVILLRRSIRGHIQKFHNHATGADGEKVAVHR